LVAGPGDPAGSGGKKCGGASAGAPDYHMRLIDLGSAIDKYSLQARTGSRDGTRAEFGSRTGCPRMPVLFWPVKNTD
ncbi:hypothetical protein, partial [Pantoea sp. Ft+CA_17]|uniref:hypothetical protein n=1 Tax=Pantoea sp. Ft+CA_17 TaxID=2929508 RepID=UPI002118F6E0